MQASVPSATVMRKDADLSFTDCKKYGRMEGIWVVSMIVMMHPRARVIMTLLVREQRVSRVGKYKARRESNPDPNPEATTLIKSMAVPESLVRSEFIALLRGRESDRIVRINSCGKSKPPAVQRVERPAMLRAMASHESSVSV